MTVNDINELTEALQCKGKGKAKNKDINQRIKRIFGNKKCGTVIHELKVFMCSLSKKDSNMAVLVVVLSLLYTNTGLMEDIKKALDKEGLIGHLYGSLCILLSGRSSRLHLEIQWNDTSFPNRYEFITCFFDSFGYWENREIIYAAKIIAAYDRAKFEELAFKDSTRLILLNMTSLWEEEHPTAALIMRLLKNGDELQANIGFYFAVWNISMDIRDYKQLDSHNSLPATKTKRQINKSFRKHLEEFHGFYSCCATGRKASLLINYILSENEFPGMFGYLLMEAELQEALVYEITSSDKIKNLESLKKIAYIIHKYPCRDVNGVRHKKDRLYTAIIETVEKYVTDRCGIYMWDTQQEIVFRSICNSLPKKYRRKLNTFLGRNIKSYMVSELDEMVRFEIYLKDKRQWEICQGMMKVLNETGVM